MKREYIKPFCETVLVQAQSMLEAVSGRFSEVSTPNTIYEHHGDPTGRIEGYDGGESLSKSNQAWEEVGGYW